MPDDVRLRSYTIPPLRMRSTDYVDMLNWQTISAEQQTPPLLRDLVITECNFENLAAFKITDANFTGKMKTDTGGDKKFDIDLLNIPCHSQAVERCIKVVTEASKHVSNDSLREGYIIAKLCNRAQMPSFLSKQQFPLEMGRAGVDLEPKL